MNYKPSKNPSTKKMVRVINDTPRFYSAGKFVTTSNRLCPIYPDSRKTFSDPKQLKVIAQEIIDFTRQKNIKFDMVIGGASAGITLATAIGLLINKPIGYVRKEAKPGGLGLAVEGNYIKGMEVLLVDDALGHGAAKPKFIKNIKAAGLKVNWVIVPMSRNHRDPEHLQWAKQMKVTFKSFCDCFDLADDAVKRKVITPEAAQLLIWYAKDAERWYDDPQKKSFFNNYLKQKNRQSKSGI